MEIKQAIPEQVMDLFEVVKCSTDPNLDCLTCCKTPYSITIRIRMAKRKGLATNGIP
jgi:hypothetical protein